MFKHIINTNTIIMFELSPLFTLADGDQEFLAELIAQYRYNIANFAASYSAQLQAGNIEELNFLIHKTQASLVMIKGQPLIDMLTQGTTLLQTNQDTAAHAALVTAALQELQSALATLAESIT